MTRVYLDWNASAPLRPEARAAMLTAMDVVGNPSSVHAEGRAAKAIVDKARGQVAALVGCKPSAVVFTSGATEAANTVICPWLSPRELGGIFWCGSAEHDCVYHLTGNFEHRLDVRVNTQGCYDRVDPRPIMGKADPKFDMRDGILALCAGNNETGVLLDEGVLSEFNDDRYENGLDRSVLLDIVQVAGKLDLEEFAFFGLGYDFGLVSGHKLGGPKGTGCLAASGKRSSVPLIVGGGQEMGRRAGTEDVIGIAGFGAAAEAAQRDLEAGVWERVAKLRDDLEVRLASAAPNLIVFGKDAPRLPNTSCFAVPGWKGETQVMQMDLAGYAVSAGSACSSGKVNKASRVLLAMGFDELTASSAIRVSIGPTTTEAEVMGFADTWIDHYRRRKERAA